MTSKIFHRGLPIDHAEAFDINGVLREGDTLRVPLTMRDGFNPKIKSAATGTAHFNDAQCDPTPAVLI